jgi:hypothetical protein
MVQTFCRFICISRLLKKIEEYQFLRLAYLELNAIYFRVKVNLYHSEPFSISDVLFESVRSKLVL